MDRSNHLYEWFPPVCTICESFEHEESKCTKKSHPSSSMMNKTDQKSPKQDQDSGNGLM